MLQANAGMFFVYNSYSYSATQESGQAYVGPVAGILSELDVNPGPDYTTAAPTETGSQSISSQTPDVFIVGGQNFASCAINTAQGGGNNILDASAGSDFLTGGSGNNQFYLDARNLASAQWDTIADAHAGDGITVWGMTPQDFLLSWQNGEGANNYTGITAHFTEYGQPEVSVTIAGYSTADLNNGKLAVTYGATASEPNAPGANYFHIAVQG